ncbi:probable cytochrome P450 305a1 [Harpegnathos saltator]|uniref:probable cytochrome P450 305a1 n=1 Tax=Harpegnathos saltator TaxID=610380 RepID=UPI000590F33B|nr:probable cytochrome P450 305a1 [Harpegnathos saltator]
MLTTILIALSLLLVYIAQQTRKRRNFPPGPFPWPLVGNQSYVHMLSRKLGGQHYAFLELCKRYGSNIISLRLGGNDVIVVSDSKLIQQVFNKEEYDGRPWNEFTKIRNFGKKKGITLNDGPEWKELRGWTVRNLKNVGFARQKMRELLRSELEIILEKLGEGGVRYVKHAIIPAVINVLWTLLTGDQLGNDTKLHQFNKLLERRAQLFDLSGGLLSSFPWLRYIMPDATGYNVLISLNNEIKNLLMATINEHKRQYHKGAEADLIDLFLYEMKREKTTKSETTLFSDDNLLLLMIDFFIAGTNNTTAALDFLFFHMVKYQDVQNKLHEEIDRVIGSNRLPNLEDKLNMPFTEAVIIECQRIWSIFPIIGPRRVLADTTLEGYTIPKNVIVLMNVFAHNMDPELYPDPESFKPERFMKDDAFQSDDNITTFGRGRRRCPGEALARSSIFLLFVGVMQKYRLLPVPGEESIKLDVTTGINVIPKPYKTLLVPR